MPPIPKSAKVEAERISMKTSKVCKLSPIERFIYWIEERYKVRMRRLSGRTKPWTDDEILQSHRFCNVRRIDDRVSQWLLNNWYTLYKDCHNMVLACTLARQLNNTESLAAIGYPTNWQPDRVQAILEERASRGLKNYSAAYMITGGYGAKGRPAQSKPYQTVWIVCDPIAKSELEVDTDSMENTWQKLLQFQGFSSFIAGQVVADLRWGLSGEWKDRYTWAPMGPGSVRGLNRLHMRPVKHHALKQGEFLQELRALITDCQDKLESTKSLEAIDWQNCLCEWDKYERVLQGEGRPKQRYNGKPA